MKETILQLLDFHFTKSVQPNLLELLSVSELWDPRTRIQDSSAENREVVARFWRAVLKAYKNQCAVCGFGVQMGGESLGIQLTHIHWHSHGGKYTIANAMALCSLHQKLFDLGGFTITDDLRLRYSSQLRVSGSTKENWIMPPQGNNIHAPNDPDHRPHPHNLAWHRREVFKP